MMTRVQTAKETTVSAKTVIRFFATVRGLVEKHNKDHHILIGGPGKTVEIDECHLHTRKYHVGRMASGECWWVVGGICRETRQIFVVVTEARSAADLNKIIFENVRAGTRILTDCWRGYNRVAQLGLGFAHATVNHKHFFVNPFDRTVHTNTIERLWRSLRESIPDQTRKENVESYIHQFVFFHNGLIGTNKTRFELVTELCAKMPVQKDIKVFFCFLMKTIK